MSLRRIAARTLLNYTMEDLWDTLQGKFILAFDDGDLEVDSRSTLYSAYAWEMHRQYPDTPLLMRHHIRQILGKKRLGSKTHLTLLGNVMWSVYGTYAPRNIMPEIELRDVLMETIYRLTNLMYNDLSYRCEEYVVSLDAVDFVEVLEHPAIKASNLEMQAITDFSIRAKVEQAIEGNHKIARDVLMSPTELPHNPLSRAMQSGLVSDGQVMQCVATRGYLTDTDSNYFDVPVMRGYAAGLRLFHDSLVESRSAAKSLIFSKTPLQQAEYFSRRAQLITQNVRNLHMGDCGSQEYVLWRVRDAEYVDGKMTYGGDLKQLVGKYYLAEDGQLRAIKASDKHLVKQTIKLRSPLGHCQHPDPYGICSTCFGELSYSVPENTNIGHMCCTSMTQKSSQNVLSVKHLDGTSAVEGIIITDNDRLFVDISPDLNGYVLARHLQGRRVTMVIPWDRAMNMTDIREAKNIETLAISRISELEEIGLIVDDPTYPRGVNPISVHVGRRYASMTLPLLKYIRERGWGVDENRNYTVDLTDWDWKEPILQLPMKHVNMSDHSADIANLLESSVEEMQERESEKALSPDQALVKFFELVNDKLSVNLAVLEVILYGTMIRSAEKRDYSLPKPGTPKRMGVFKLSMFYRSLAPMMAYQDHGDVITDPESYIIRNRPDHPMDALICPKEVLG